MSGVRKLKNLLKMQPGQTPTLPFQRGLFCCYKEDDFNGFLFRSSNLGYCHKLDELKRRPILKYTRERLFALRHNKLCRQPTSDLLHSLSESKLLHYRGARGGKGQHRKIHTLISKRIDVVYNRHRISRPTDLLICIKTTEYVARAKVIQQASILVPPPTLYVFNAAALSKPHAIEQLKADLVNQQIDVAIISETKLKPKHCESCISIDGYTVHRLDRMGRQGGGVAVYVSSIFNSVVWESKSESTNKQHELLWVKIIMPKQLVFIGALYHPPRPVYEVSGLLERLERTIEELSVEHPEALVILGGDLNQLSDTDIMVRTGMEQIVQHPTRGQSYLDRIYTNFPCNYHVQVITSLVKSDHKAIVARSNYLQVLEYSKCSKTCKYRLKSPAQNAQFLQYLSRCDLDLGTACESGSCQDAFDNFYEFAISALEQFYPEKSIRMTQKDPDYLTPSIKALLRKKNKLMRRGHLDEANQHAKRIGKEIAKRTSVRLRGMTSNRDAKDLWTEVRKLTGGKSQIVVADGVDAIALNNHYAGISADSDYVAPVRKAEVNIFIEQPYSEWEIFKMLDSLKPTATGLDKLPSWFLRLGAPIFAKHLANLFNRSILESSVPSQWKKACIRPIQKIPNPKQLSDYRPISITPVLARTMERAVVRKFIYPALINPPALLSFDDQYAFKPAGSCTAALIDMFHSITEMLQTHPYVVVIALDFSKAFDTVRHASVASKMALLDLPVSVYNWFVSYLEGHSHQTIFDGQESEFKSISASVIQGSALGPSSYIVVASDLHPMTTGNRIFKFADDTYLVVPASNVETRTSELNHIQSWAVTNNLFLNRTKSKEIVFKKPRSRLKLVVPILSDVERVEHLKVLGVVITWNFSMQEHIGSVITSSGRALYALKILRAHGLNQESLHQVYQSTVISRLTYACQAWWGFTNAACCDRIDSFIKKSSRAGFYKNNSPCFSELCQAADDRLFHSIVANPYHPLHHLLPPKIEKIRDTRRRTHSFTLPNKVETLFEKNFIIRMLYKDIY